MAQQKRSPPEIIARILEAAKEGQRKTRIMYDVRVDHRTLEKYLEYLTSKSLLERDGPGYRATEKGRRYLERYREAESILEG